MGGPVVVVVVGGLEGAAVVDWAWVKSGERVGSLGWVRVDEVEAEVKPWN